MPSLVPSKGIMFGSLEYYMTLHILVVAHGALVFGCIKARDLCGNDAVIVLYETLRQRYVDIVPQVGDILCCRHSHSSVYIPVVRIVQSMLCLRALPIPYDVLRYYFPMSESLRCTGD